MADATVKAVFVGDSSSLERTFSKVGSSAVAMAGDFDKAESKAKGFGDRMGNVGESVGGAEGKFMGTADLLDGLGGAFGLPTEGATGLFRAFGDLSGGFEVVSGLFGPLLGKIGAMIGLTGAATAATEAETGAQVGLNAAMTANPIGLVVAAIAALIAAGFLVVKNWDTIKSAFSATWGWIKDRFGDVVGLVSDLGGKIAGAARGMFDGIRDAFKTAINWIIDRWNGLEFKVPGFKVGPVGFDGFTLGMPDIPKLHTGGTVPGVPGTEVPIMALAGETVGRGNGTETINLVVDGQVLATVVRDRLLRMQRQTPLGFVT